MKKLFLTLALIVATLTATADNILYFTYGQAARTVAVLNNEDELMIYCGYEDELPTYCLINEVWAEQISSSFFEIWIYGWDAYTGDEIYMPIDLECIYLLRNGHMYSAAQYLRFRYTHHRPTFAWSMPPYHHFTRYPRPTHYYYTYHYDIHRHGWHYCNYGHMHYHPYYRRYPHQPAPMHSKPFHPGKERPGYKENPNGGYTTTDMPLVGNITTSRSQIKVQYDHSGREGSRITSNRGDNTITTTDRRTGTRSTSAAPDRSDISSGRTVNNNRGTNSTGRESTTSTSTSRGGNDNSRGTISSSTTSRGGNDNSRGTSTSRGNDNSRGTISSSSTSRGDNDNSRGNASTSSNSRSNATSTDNSRGSVSSSNSSRSNSASTSSTSSRENNSSASTPTTSRGNSASTSSSSSRGNSSASTSSSSRGNSSASTSTSARDNNASTSSSSSRGNSSNSRANSTSGSSRSANSSSSNSDNNRATSTSSRGNSTGRSTSSR